MRFGLQNVLEWHPWFAWHPIRVDGEIVWLEWVWRRDICSDAAAWACAPIWEYDL